MDVDWTVEEALAQYDDCGTFLFPHGGGMQLQALQQAVASGDLPARVLARGFSRTRGTPGPGIDGHCAAQQQQGQDGDQDVSASFHWITLHVWLIDGSDSRGKVSGPSRA
jgi:hypothetical protein